MAKSKNCTTGTGRGAFRLKAPGIAGNAFVQGLFAGAARQHNASLNGSGGRSSAGPTRQKNR
jgi:hypothetical protein